MKLYEKLKQFVPKEIELRGEKLTFNKFSAATQIYFESKGMDIQAIFDSVEETPTSTITELAYVLMTDECKEGFGSLANFRSCLNILEIGILSKLTLDIINEAMLKEVELKND